MHTPLSSLLACCALANALGAQQPPKAAVAPATIAGAIYSTRGDNKVHLVSLPELKPLASYDADAGAHELAISADGKWALGSAYGGPGKGHQPVDNRVFVLDLPAGKRTHMVDLGAVKRPNDIAFLGSSTEAIVTTEVPAQLLRLDAATGKYTAFALEHRANHMLALSPDQQTCFVSHVAPGGITRFDLGTNKATRYGVLPTGAEGIACSGDGKRIWVGCNRSSKLVVVDSDTLQVVQEVERGGFPLRVKASPDGKRIAVSCPMSGEVALYDAADAAQAQVIDLRKTLGEQVSPTSIAFAADSKLLIVVANGEPDHVLAIDVATSKVVADITAAGPIADALAAGMVQAPAAAK